MINWDRQRLHKRAFGLAGGGGGIINHSPTLFECILFEASWFWFYVLPNM